MIAVDNVGQAGLLEPSRSRAFAASLREFLLVGGVTPFLFALSWWVQRCIGLDSSEYAIGFLTFYAAFVINDPHFAVTYLLFYRDGVARAFDGALKGSQRARYLVAGVVVPLVLVVWAAGGARDEVGGRARPA